jgi:hypothetical protein
MCEERQAQRAGEIDLTLKAEGTAEAERLVLKQVLAAGIPEYPVHWGTTSTPVVIA